jgi:three-Cys-motif partner protein
MPDPNPFADCTAVVCYGNAKPTDTHLESNQADLFSGPELIKQDNVAIVKAYQERLRKVVGFEFVPDPLPMRNSNNAVVYYLFFASQKPVAKKIIEDIFKKHRRH